MRFLRRCISIMGAQPNPWRFMVSRVLRVARVSHWITMTVPPGIRLRLYPTSLSEAYWMMPRARSQDHDVFEAWLTPGMTVVDVGANIGGLTIHASRIVGDRGRVVSIEAHPRIYKYLLGNLRLNRCTNVQAIHSAVGSSMGTLTFSDLKQDDVNHVIGAHNPGIPDVTTYGGSRSVGVSVPMETLDSLIEGVPVDLLKVDVEGFERMVLEGAMKTLSRTEFVYIESFERSFAEYGYRSGDVLAILRGQGFTVFAPSGGAWEKISLDHVSYTVENLVALRDPALMTRLARVTT